MFRYLIIFTVLLGLKPAETVPNLDASSIKQILKTLHQLYPKFAQAHILEDAVLNKILAHIKSGRSTNITEIASRVKEISNKINSRLKEVINNINKLANKTKSRLNEITNDINKKLPKDCPKSDNEKKKKAEYPTSCLRLNGGLQKIKLAKYIKDPFFVYCDNVTQRGGWTVIQRRRDGSVDFYRKWDEYEKGFGNLTGEFFIGLQKLYAMTTLSPHELLVVMRDKQKVEKYAKYDAFTIAHKNADYQLSQLGWYSGNAGDGMHAVRGGHFYTKDRDSPNECVKKFPGAWWQDTNHCAASLNGNYGDDREWKGINWSEWHGYKYSLPCVTMMIRPKI